MAMNMPTHSAPYPSQSPTLAGGGWVLFKLPNLPSPGMLEDNVAKYHLIFALPLAAFPQ
jgi:hypothetical protein